METRIFTADKKTEFEFTTSGPLYVPFYNKWGKNVYWQTEAFDLDPVHLDADSTSGSPVLINGDLFIGFLNGVGGRFIYDGVRSLKLILESGQKVMIKENCNPYEAWEEYNIYFQTSFKEEQFWQRLEYCTWVEQSKQSALAGNSNYDIINEKFVYSFVERIEKMGLPKGKLTIDDGWAINTLADGRYTSGNWDVDPIKFPHFETLIRELTDAGYTPGLWFSPFSATPDTELIKQNPNLLTDNYFRVSRNQRYFVFDEDVLRPYYHEIFGRYIDMGIKKLKLDIAYSVKSDMISMLRVMSEEIRSIDPTVEIESHIPDIFATPYCDTVRLNDVSIDDDGKWKGVAAGHYDVCRRSAAGKILNLDHIGSNASLPDANNYMAHWHLLRSFLLESKSYPVVSNLPDSFSEKICTQFCDEINELYDKDGYRK